MSATFTIDVAKMQRHNHHVFLELLQKRCPRLDLAKAHNLAAVWSRLVDLVVDRTLQIGLAEVGQGIPRPSRPDAIHEMARLLLFVDRSVLTFKAKQQPLETYDPQAELDHLYSEGGQTMVETTARNVADGAWKPLLLRWRKQHPLIVPPPEKNPPRRLRKNTEPHRSRMHFVPQFSTRPWVDAVSGKFDVHQIGFDGEVRTSPGTAKVWGATDYLYSQALEVRFGNIEREARGPYDKLRRRVPLTEIERSHWIAFLLSQLVRTPGAMATLMSGLKALIDATGTRYPTDPAHLARAIETVFSQNEAYAGFHRLIVSKRWTIAKCPPQTSFLKGDHPVALNGSVGDGTWTLIYPLTPSICFVAGPEKAQPGPLIVSQGIELTTLQAATYNALICRQAAKSVIARKAADDPAHLRIVKANLGVYTRPTDQALPHWGLDLGSAKPPLRRASVVRPVGC
ncbi:DUF4238 domain-containing protein [Caulobacter sp. LARHSG274]